MIDSVGYHDNMVGIVRVNLISSFFFNHFKWFFFFRNPFKTRNQYNCTICSISFFGGGTPI